MVGVVAATPDLRWLWRTVAVLVGVSTALGAADTELTSMRRIGA